MSDAHAQRARAYGIFGQMTSSTLDNTVGNHWPRAERRFGDAVWTGAVVAAAAASIWPTWPSLHDLWMRTTDYSHGYLVAGLSLGWFAYRCLNLGRIVLRPSLTGTCALAGVLAGWLVLFKASVILGEQALAPLILWTAIWSCCGGEAARRLAAPIGYLYFAVPVWDAVAPTLQTITVAACRTSLAWFHVPALVHGSVVRIPEGTFEIAEACSGKRYFVSALGLAAFFAATAPLRGARAPCFVAIAAGVAMIANWIRVFTVIYAGHATHMTSYLVAKEHGTFGWAVYFVVLVFVLWVGARLERSQGPPPAASPAETTLSATPSSRPASRAYAGLALLGLTFAAVLYARSTPALNHAPVATLPAPRAAGWSGPLPPDSQWSPHFVGAAPQSRGQYRFGQTAVEVYIARYAHQVQGAKLVSSLNTLLGESWVPLAAGRLAGRTEAGGIPARAVLAEVPGSGQRWVVSFVYKVGDVVTGSSAIAQLAYGTLSWTAPAPAEVVAVAVKCSSSCDAAEAAVTAVWRALGAQLL